VVQHHIWSSGWGRWILFLLGWTLLSLMFVPEVYLYFLYRSEAIAWTHAVALALVNAAIAFLFLPPIVWLARRYPVERHTWKRAIAVHAPACFVFVLSHSGLYALACYASPGLFHALFVRFHPNVLTYWAIVGFTQAVDYFDRYRERERQLAQAELLLLKSQLHPHFLFNALHTVSAMMHEDVAAADRMVSRLSDLLRTMFETIGVHEVPLRQELDFLKNYVAIEQARFPDRLTLTVNVEPELLDALVPNMLLQPLVENSIRHGLDLGRGAGVIEVAASRADDSLLLAVRDNGRGLRPAVPIVEGLGLSNTRVRLRELYGDRYVFRLESNNPSGLSAFVGIPLRSADGQEAGPGSEVVSYVHPSVDCGRRAVGAEAAVVAVSRRARL
jgi:two-component system, LytTR family, sensor kinase